MNPRGAGFSTLARNRFPTLRLATGLLFPSPMNALKTPTPLPEILTVLEAIAAALRQTDTASSAILQRRAFELLSGRSVDCCERMILGKVLGRIAKLVGGGSFVQAVESHLAIA